MTGERISGSSLIARKAQPTDPLIDTFNFGPDDWSREVEEEFKSRIWFKSKSPLFLFLRGSADLDGEELVAGARFGYGNLPDPASGDADETERAHFYLVMSFGVQVTCQHRNDPLTSPPRRWASVVMDHAESKARAKDRCVGSPSGFGKRTPMLRSSTGTGMASRSFAGPSRLFASPQRSTETRRKRPGWRPTSR